MVCIILSSNDEFLEFQECSWMVYYLYNIHVCISVHIVRTTPHHSEIQLNTKPLPDAFWQNNSQSWNCIQNTNTFACNIPHGMCVCVRLFFFEWSFCEESMLFCKSFISLKWLFKRSACHCCWRCCYWCCVYSIHNATNSLIYWLHSVKCQKACFVCDRIEMNLKTLHITQCFNCKYSSSSTTYNPT